MRVGHLSGTDNVLVCRRWTSGDIHTSSPSIPDWTQKRGIGKRVKKVHKERPSLGYEQENQNRGRKCRTTDPTRPTATRHGRTLPDRRCRVGPRRSGIAPREPGGITRVTLRCKGVRRILMTKTWTRVPEVIRIIKSRESHLFLFSTVVPRPDWTRSRRTWPDRRPLT